jgi:hypothetical protein
LSPIEETTMLQTLSSLRKLSIRAIDGEIGSVEDSYFDDDRWVLRYLVVDTGGWLPGREVLISPFSVSGIDWRLQLLDLSITSEQLKSSPSIDMDKPVSRQQEAALLDYYGYPYYWGGMMPWGISASPAIVRPPPVDYEEQLREQRKREEHSDPHLRSAKHVTGYHIEASDGMIGHVEDFIFNPQTWALRYFIVDTRNWLPGRHVLLATDWIDEVSWDKRTVRVVPLTREAIRSSPEWDEQKMLNESDELGLYRHYGKTLDAGLRGGQLR